MVISGMNRFFARHGRVTLGVLVVIISVSFVLYLSGASVASLFSFRYRDHVGTIAGKNVTREEYLQQVDRTILGLCLESPMYSPKQVSRDRVAPAALHRLVQLYAAKEQGIDVDRAEIAEYLRSSPVFQRDGKFSLDTFESYLKVQLDPLGFTRQDLDDAARESLIIQRLQRDIMEAVIVSPSEVRDAFNSNNEKFLVKALRFEPTEADEAITPTDEEIAGFFESHRDRYPIPPQCRLDIVRFNHLDFQAAAAAEVTDELIAKYYQDHAAEFTTGEGEAATVKPLAEASADIRTKLTDERVREMSRVAAERFADDIFNFCEDAVERARPGTEAEVRTVAFRSFVAERGMKSSESDWFSADTTDIPRVGHEPELIRSAMELYPDQPISDAISGNRAAFVALLLERQEEHPAELAEVKNRVTADLREDKIRGLVRERARIACLAIGEAITAGTEFAAAAKAAGVVPEDVTEFSASQPPMVKDGYVIGELATTTPAGQVSRTSDTYRGALAVWVEKRTSPDEAEYNEQKDSFTNRYRSWKAGNAWQGYTLWLQSQAQFAFQP